MSLNQKFPTKLAPDATEMLVIVEHPFFPRALCSDDGILVFADVSGELSNPIPIPKSVSFVNVHMPWLSDDHTFSIPVPTHGWVNLHGTPTYPQMFPEMKWVFSYSTPHTPSYAGGDSSGVSVRLETVIRPGDLPFRRDAKGTWTASGLLLQHSEGIPLDRSFEIFDLEKQEIILVA